VPRHIAAHQGVGWASQYSFRATTQAFEKDHRKRQ